jgi:hypothetical protein
MNASVPPIQSFESFEAETLPILVQPFISKFNAVPWSRIDAPGPEHRWLVKGLITEGELSMLAGASQSGKSFLTLDLAMAIARGQEWFGRRVQQGGVAYQAGEGAAGLRRKRIPAYMRENKLTAADDLPFVFLPGKINLWDGNADTDAFIAEVKHWTSQMTVPLRLIIIDTLSKAMTGGDEISGKDMGAVIQRCDLIRQATGAAVLLVHHMNAGGEKVRGHTSIMANLDSVLLCRMASVAGGRGQTDTAVTDADNRKVRELLVGKAKDGESDVRPDRFVLRAVEIGRDTDGDPITSCVVAMPAGDDLKATAKSALKPISTKLSIAMKGLKAAVEAVGRNPPADVPHAPAGMSCITLSDWRDHLAPLLSEEGENSDDLKERVRDFLRKTAIPPLVDRNYVRKHGDWVWRTNRKLAGIDPEPVKAAVQPEAPVPDLGGLDPTIPW